MQWWAGDVKQYSGVKPLVKKVSKQSKDWLMSSSWGWQKCSLRCSEIPCSLVRIRSAVQIDWDICCPMCLCSEAWSVWTLQPGLCISYMYTFQDQTVVWSVQCQHNAVYYSLWSIWPVHHSASQCISVHWHTWSVWTNRDGGAAAAPCIPSWQVSLSSLVIVIVFTRQ